MIGYEIKNINLATIPSFTAAATGDNTETTSAVLDRLGYDSLTLSIGFKTALTTAKKLTNILKVQQSDDNSAWSDATTLYAVHDLATKTTEGLGIKEYDINLKGYKRYIKFLYTLDLTATATDTCEGYVNATLGDSQVKPV